MQEAMINKAKQLLADGTVDRVIGWKRGEFVYDITPAVFETVEELEANFVYDDFTSANVSKYLVKESRKEGRILAFLKPCDTYSFNQLIKEHRVVRENVYIIGIPGGPKLDIEKIKAKGITGILGVKNENYTLEIDTVYGKENMPFYEAILDKCSSCKSKKHVIYDELMGEEGDVLDSNRFDMVEKLENMTAQERFNFWREQLSKCIRCNACRNVCPACTCEKCVFDNPDSGIENKAPSDSFEENMFHIIRAFHVAGRCTDCGECSRVCPQNIPLHLLNRKFIKDINAFYGEYQAGEDTVSLAPLNEYKQDDCETGIVHERGVE
ncbi:4Fe-4S dicluster domain-containing protein [Ruminococcus sp.]|uniref:4Fe-4S dicluster domain-containing protein n=1 Tax=Ruminococcus sp. TaxID=41978 RepID=UPI001B79D624|nr:4Fe-4S dicluster domain-containing protein [Ruminococcus sp.]MBP5430974.1 4Fe-4S dicluster domain-containing protein [Ruminococcus sp.]